MIVRFTKRPNNKGQLTCVRSGSSTTIGEMVPGMGRQQIPHDMIHLSVENNLGFTTGVYGLIAGGMSIEELLSPENKMLAKNHWELLRSEQITIAIQTELVYGMASPEIAGKEFDCIREEINLWRQEWIKIEEGQTIEKEFVGD